MHEYIYTYKYTHNYKTQNTNNIFMNFEIVLLSHKFTRAPILPKYTAEIFYRNISLH